MAPQRSSCSDIASKELVNELMSARRAVRGAATEIERRAARRGVHDAKVALGERGRPSWLDRRPVDLQPRIEAAIRALLRSRRDGASMCPSEAARIVDGQSWRRLLQILSRRHAVRVRISGSREEIFSMSRPFQGGAGPSIFCAIPDA